MPLTIDVDDWHAAWHVLERDHTPSTRSASIQLPRLPAWPSSPVANKRDGTYNLAQGAEVAPSFALFHLRTGCALEQRSGCARLRVGAAPPHHVTETHGARHVLEMCAENVHGASLPSLMRNTTDRQMVLRALRMAQCPAGVVSLGVRARAAYFFLIIRSVSTPDQAAQTLCVEVSECGRAPAHRLEPCLHTQWWTEEVQDPMRQAGDPFLRKYYRDEDEDEDEDEDDDEDTDDAGKDDVGAPNASSGRNPLEVEATARFLTRDLIRRAGLHHAALPSPTSLPSPVSSPSSSVPASPDKTRPRSGRNSTFLTAVSTALKRSGSSPALQRSCGMSALPLSESNAHTKFIGRTVFGRPPSPPRDVVGRPSSAPPPMASPLPPMLLQDMCNISQQTVCTDPDLHHISQSVTSAHHQSLPPTRARSSYSRCKKAVGVLMSKISSPARSTHATCKSRAAQV
jgi:hypothetical protein